MSTERKTAMEKLNFSDVAFAAVESSWIARIGYVPLANAFKGPLAAMDSLPYRPDGFLLLELKSGNGPAVPLRLSGRETRNPVNKPVRERRLHIGAAHRATSPQGLGLSRAGLGAWSRGRGEVGRRGHPSLDPRPQGAGDRLAVRLISASKAQGIDCGVIQ